MLPHKTIKMRVFCLVLAAQKGLFNNRDQIHGKSDIVILVVSAKVGKPYMNPSIEVNSKGNYKEEVAFYFLQ